MRVAAAQIVCRVGDISANCGTLARLAHQAAGEGCGVVVFPEMADTGYDMKTIVEKAGSWDGGAFQFIAERASALRIWIICGLSERAQDGVYNSVAVIDRDGRLAGHYRKAHLFSPAGEDRFLKRGNSLLLCAIEDMRWGIMACYDLRFPEMARLLALKGAEAIAVPSAFPFPRINHWSTLLAGRAIENQLYMIGANRAGTDAGAWFCGASRIIDPYGVTTASAPETGEQLIMAEISSSRVREVRGSIPVYRDRRPDLYAE